MPAQLLESVAPDAYEHSVAVYRAIRIWLAMPASDSPLRELDALQEHLEILPSLTITPEQRSASLAELQHRGDAALDSALHSLSNLSLPIPRKARQLARKGQGVMHLLAEQVLDQLTDHEPGVTVSEAAAGEVLLRVLLSLERHLFIGYLTAMSASSGVWRSVHEIFQRAIARQGGGASWSLADHRIRSAYKRIVLLGCAQPASFTGQALLFAKDYLDRFGDLAEFVDAEPDDTNAFWIDLSRDTGAQASARRAPSTTEATTIALSCEALTAKIGEHLASLAQGTPPTEIDLPEFAGSPLGIATLQRLRRFWSEPAKRRFPRRRQHYRVVLCSGLEDLWHLFGDSHQRSIETSGWMITNESPDGCAIMHVMGKLANAVVGDIVAIRNETGRTWQICLIRWAQSENHEHLELGLQILSSKAVPAALIQTGDEETAAARHVVLLLPPIPPLRAREVLIAATGWIKPNHAKMVLLVDQERIEIREIHRVESEYNELSERIEMFAIESDPG